MDESLNFPEAVCFPALGHVHPGIPKKAKCKSKHGGKDSTQDLLAATSPPPTPISSALDTSADSDITGLSHLSSRKLKRSKLSPDTFSRPSFKPRPVCGTRDRIVFPLRLLTPCR